MLTYSGPITDTASLAVLPDHIRNYDRINNQLRLYYHPDSLPVRVITENIKEFRDTIDVVAQKKKIFELTNLEIARLNPTFLPGESLNFMTNWPILSVDTSLMQLNKQKSNQFLLLDTVSANFNVLHIKYPWTADSSYVLTLLPGAIAFENNINHDTLKYQIKPVAPESLASLVVTLMADENYKLPPQFILQLKQKDKVIDQKTVSELNKSTTFSALKPGAYTLDVIWDENQNGIWDPARYPGRLPAERIQKVEIENLRINWIQEMEVKLISDR